MRLESVLVPWKQTAGGNFEALAKAEADIAALKATNEALQDRLDDQENRSCRANLRIINVPEDSEIGTDMIKFTSDLLKDVMGDQVFEKTTGTGESTPRTGAQTQRWSASKTHYRLLSSIPGEGTSFALGQATRAAVPREDAQSLS